MRRRDARSAVRDDQRQDQRVAAAVGDGYGADLRARLQRGAQVLVERDVRLRCGHAFAHDDGVRAREHRLHAVRFGKPYAHGRNDRVGCDGIERIVGKGEVEERRCVGEARLGALRVQHHGNVLHAVALGAGRQAVHGLLGVAGLQAGRAGVGVDELVGVGEAEAAVAHGVHPDGGVVADARMGQQCAGHARDVARRRVVAGIVGQPRAVEKLRVFHAQFFRAVVHALGERLLGTGDVLCHGDGAVIGGVDGDALEHLVDAHLLALLEPDLAAAHGAGVGAGGHDIARGKLAAVELLHDEQQRHDLRHAGGGQVLIGIFLV